MVAWEFSISKGTLSDYAKNKVKVKTGVAKSIGSQHNTLSNASHPKLEEALYIWLSATFSKNVPVSGDLLKRKAETLALQMKINSIKFSDCWL